MLPPENNIEKNTTKDTKFLYAKFVLDNGYAVNPADIKAIKVPRPVDPIVTAYALSTLLLLEKAAAYASVENSFGIKEKPSWSNALSLENDAEITSSNGKI